MTPVDPLVLAERLEQNAEVLENGPYVSLKETRETFREAAQALRQFAWRPISEAKREHGDVLAFCEFRERHHMLVGAIAPDGHFRSWPGRQRYANATHFMPLPAPPQTKD